MCNSILYGMSDSVISYLQHIQTTAARIIAKCGIRYLCFVLYTYSCVRNYICLLYLCYFIHCIQLSYTCISVMLFVYVCMYRL